MNYKYNLIKSPSVLLEENELSCICIINLEPKNETDNHVNINVKNIDLSLFNYLKNDTVKFDIYCYLDTHCEYLVLNAIGLCLLKLNLDFIVSLKFNDSFIVIDSNKKLLKFNGSDLNEINKLYKKVVKKLELIKI
ncbi:hypothetical protein A0H76_873 [Hepatospora eriocheir]|uniref:Uncharacterized protein n=1 Tax=Hepatospora eriocheir TaxID=1081669 RepID=A0A1X0QLN7_9MICR|nr:hypothetical protein A0H76_873 [Hepatospora eriocheir]